MQTREEWLQAATHTIRDWFAFADESYIVPAQLRISVGFPFGGRGGKLKRIGECWSPDASADATTEIFVSPEIGDGLEALAVLVHELVHSVVGLKAKHGIAFKHCASAMGLEGKMTATVAGAALKERLNTLMGTLGAYPHAALTPSKSGRKKQGTRLVKCVCPSCGYTARTTAKWLETGPLVCGPCQEEMQST